MDMMSMLPLFMSMTGGNNNNGNNNGSGMNMADMMKLISAMNSNTKGGNAPYETVAERIKNQNAPPKQSGNGSMDIQSMMNLMSMMNAGKSNNKSEETASNTHSSGTDFEKMNGIMPTDVMNLINYFSNNGKNGVR